MTKTLADLYQAYPEHFASGAKNVARENVIAKVQERYPDFKERFTCGSKNRPIKRKRILLPLMRYSATRD